MSKHSWMTAVKKNRETEGEHSRPDLPSGPQCSCPGMFLEPWFQQWSNPCLLSADWSGRADEAAPRSARRQRSPEPESGAWFTDIRRLWFNKWCWVDCLRLLIRANERTSSSWCVAVPLPASWGRSVQRWGRCHVSRHPTPSQLCRNAHLFYHQLLISRPLMVWRTLRSDQNSWMMFASLTHRTQCICRYMWRCPWPLWRSTRSRWTWVTGTSSSPRKTKPCGGQDVWSDQGLMFSLLYFKISLLYKYLRLLWQQWMEIWLIKWINECSPSTIKNKSMI